MSSGVPAGSGFEREAHGLKFGERLDEGFHPTLQEFFGYAMVPDTTVHRFVTFTGPPRSGKSTAKNVLERLVGRAHIAQKQLSDLGKEFGLQDAIDKRLIVIPDARDVPGGQRGPALERLLLMPHLTAFVPACGTACELAGNVWACFLTDQ